MGQGDPGSRHRETIDRDNLVVSGKQSAPSARFAHPRTHLGANMASGVFDDALLKHLWSTDELRAIFNDGNRVQKWYDFEAALALEEAALGIIPSAAAQKIAAKARVDHVNIKQIAEKSAASSIR